MIYSFCTNIDQDTSELEPCQHEEADSRLMIDVADCAKRGHRSAAMRTVDVEVVALCVAVAAELNITQLWAAIGSGKAFRYIEVHLIVQSIGKHRSKPIPMFHSFIVCDTVSSFAGRGKHFLWESGMSSLAGALLIA